MNLESSIKDGLEKALDEFVDEHGDIQVGDEEEVQKAVEKYFELKKTIHVESTDEMFDSCGFDAWSYAIAWIEDGKPELLVYRLVSS